MVIVLRNNAFHDVSDCLRYKHQKVFVKNLRVKPTYIDSTIIIAVVVVVIIMSPNRRVPFELCNTEIKQYYLKLFVTYFTCCLVSILALEVQQHYA